MVEKIKKIFQSENSIRSASVILLITLTLSNLLGLLRDHFLSGLIPTARLDIYFASFRIPDLIFNFLILGSISSAFIPVFCDYISQKKNAEAWKIASSLVNIALLVTTFCAIIMFFLLPWIIPLIVPEFSPEAKSQTVNLTRILMITPIFFSASYIVSGVLNSFNKFLVYSLAPLFYNLSIIIGTLIFAPKYGIVGVAWFVVVGSLIHFLVQFPAAYHTGFRFRFILDFKSEAMKKIAKLMLPRSIGLGVNQLLLLIYTAIASSLASGSIAAFNFANNIQTMPTVVFGTSFATALFPTLTKSVSLENPEQFSYYLNKTIRTIAFLLFPCSALFILLRAQIIRLILGSGYFVWQDTKSTALVLAFFAVSLFFQGAIPLFARAFYALKNTLTPMIVGLISAIVGIVFGYLLSPLMSVAGLALAFSISSFINACLLFYLLQRKSFYKFDNRIYLSLLKTALITLVVAAVAQLLKHLIANYVDMTRFFGVLTQTLLVTGISATLYIALAYFFSCEELFWALKKTPTWQKKPNQTNN